MVRDTIEYGHCTATVACIRTIVGSRTNNVRNSYLRLLRLLHNVENVHISINLTLMRGFGLGTRPTEYESIFFFPPIQASAFPFDPLQPGAGVK